ncbi:MAG: hypothetical protein ABJE95_28490 [Byssovorax sp.]
MVRCRLLLAIAMLLLSVPARAARPHAAVALEYSPGATSAARCPAATVLREEVQIRIGYDLFQPGAQPRLAVKIDRASGRYRVRAELRSEPDRVAFAGTFAEVDCGAAIRSLAIAVAIHFTRAPESCASPAPLENARSAVPPPPPPRAPAPPERIHAQMGIASTLAVGSAPVVVGGAAWLLGARWAGFSASLEGRALFAPSASLPGPRSQVGYHILVAAVAVAACVHPSWAFACSRVEWTSVAISNTTLDIDPNHLSRLGIGFRFGGERTLTRSVALRAFVETSFNPSSSSLRTQTPSAPAIWREPILSASLGVGPVVTF